MELRINGDTQNFENDQMSVHELLEALDIPTVKGVAIAVNDTVVSQSAWADSAVCDGDRIEIIRATQGG
jgi:sulfur carrier protein